MQAEIEAKFVDIDIADIRARLEKAGAVLEQPMRDMKRVMIEEEQHEARGLFLRIRDEGSKVTLCLKKRTKSLGDSAADSTYEIETTVGDFDKTVEIFKIAGWHYTTFQESRRETWQLDSTEIVIDEWPWIKPYIEIEGPTEDIVRTAAKKLGFKWEDAVFGSVDIIYNRDYPDMTVRGVVDIKEVRFGDQVPAEFGQKKD